MATTTAATTTFPTNLCPQRAGELPCIPRQLFRGSTPVVRAALAQLGLR